MKFRLTILLACLLSAGIGFLGGRATRETAPSQTALLAPPPAGPSGISMESAPAPHQEAAPAGQAAGVHALNLLRVALATHGDHAEACLVFSAPLSRAGDFHAGDFLRIEPAVKPAIRVDGNMVCLAGLDFATSYKVTTLAGLPGDDGSRMLSDETLPLSLGDLPQTADFADDGFILARGSAQGLPIATVNKKSVHFRVDRITDRVLVRTALGRDYSDNEGDSDTLGVRLWEGDLAVAPGRNEKITTAFPLNQVLDHRLPGAYRITLIDKRGNGRGDESEDNKYRWLFNTDLMLTSHRGADGMHVFVRSLATARPLRGVAVALLAANNDELGRAETNADGQAIFPAALLRGGQGLVPHMVMAYLSDDFTALELDRPGFDLSDRGVDGRPDPGNVDGYLYTDRGIYRPGETIELGTIVRDHLALPLPEGQAVAVVLRRPDGVEAGTWRLEPNGIGVAVTGIPLKTTAPRGTWKLEERLAGTAPLIGVLDVQVQDFVPNRLAVELAPKSARITSDAPAVIDVASRYLYGAPAADLNVSAHVELQRDTQPVAEPGWQFGRAGESLNAEAQDIDAGKTDAQGHAMVSIDSAALKIPDTSLPLRADITVSVAEPGGRATETRTSLPVTTHDVLLGLRAPNDEGELMEDKAASIAVAAFAPGGARVAHDVGFRVLEQVTKFDYYFEDGRWRWKSATHDRPVTFGSLSVPASQGGIALNLPPLPWGTYRVEVSESGGAFTSLVLHSGYSPDPDQADSPEKVSVSLVGPPPRAGGTARLHIKPPFGGQVLVTVENDRVLAAQTAAISADGADVSVTASADWGVGAYVMASVYRPAGAASGHAPVRAVGLAYVKLDVTDRTLGVALAAPSVLRPRTHLDLGVTVTGEAARHGPVWMTLAAVDEGILDLTRFASPDPAAHFFGKRRLAVDLRDDYSHLIDGNGAAAGAVRAGGDLDGAGLSVVPTRTTALFSGLVRVGADGHAVVPLDLPDFTGGLRFMAVAVSATGFGHAESQIPVRDPVVAQMSLPRFLAPGDAGRVTLLAHNVEAPAGVYHVHLAGEGALGVTPVDEDITLAARQAVVKTYPVTGGDAGIGKLVLTLTGPGGMHIVHDWPIEIRTPFQSVTRVTREDQAPGETVVLSPALADGLVAKGASIRASFSAIGGIDLPGLLASLDEYPFGCSEQLVSRAMPLLYVEQEAKLAGVSQPDLRFRIQDAVDKLLERQNEGGAFGLWRAGDGQAEPYLGSEITDFLNRARAHGYAVPAHALSQAAKALSDMQDYDLKRFWYWRLGQQEDTDAENYVRRAGRAYALLLAARAGQADVADLRYMHDTDLDKLEPLGKAQLGVGLALLGDKPRATHAFDAAEAALGHERDELFFRAGDYYRTRLRDTAAMVSLAAEMGDRPRTARLIEALSHMDMRTERLSTQEQGWLVIAAGVLLERAGPVSVSVDGAAQPQAAVVVVRRDVPGLQPVSVRNDGTGIFTRMVAVRGLPIEAPPAASSGVSIAKTVTAADGSAIDLAHLRQGQRLVVHVSGRAFDTAYHQAILVDPLPAGFEIERVVAPSTDKDANGLPWLGDISPTRTAEKRDDRFIAAIDLNRAPGEPDENGKTVPPSEAFNLAYVVRVVSPGRFVLPAASIADMYRPDVQARGAPGMVSVDAAQ
jgi:uncharacterized protein YfaS (alpha-2-macroglobulin family)